MMISDLKQFLPGSPPSPYGIPLDIKRDGAWGRGFLTDDVTLRAVGWLGDRVDCIGDVSDSCIDRLFVAYERSLKVSGEYRGFHACEVCSGELQHNPGGHVGPIVVWKERELSLIGDGHYLIRFERTVYMAPALLLHYILDHQYRPPDEFEKAVIEGRFLTADDLVFRPSMLPPLSYSTCTRLILPKGDG